jgi:hypothetical protein
MKSGNIILKVKMMLKVGKKKELSFIEEFKKCLFKLKELKMMEENPIRLSKSAKNTKIK